MQRREFITLIGGAAVRRGFVGDRRPLEGNETEFHGIGALERTMGIFVIATLAASDVASPGLAGRCPPAELVVFCPRIRL
jgi:hypothetical protein